MKLIETHQELPSPKMAKAMRQLPSEWVPSALREMEKDFRPHPEQPQTVWDHVWNLGQDITRERQFAH